MLATSPDACSSSTLALKPKMLKFHLDPAKVAAGFAAAGTASARRLDHEGTQVMNVRTAQELTPRAWIGCLACYNSGKLVGEWFEAGNASDVTLIEVHGGLAQVHSECEELWCFDTDNIPVSREMGPHEATQWAEVFAEVGERLWPALHAWVRSGPYSTQHSSDLPVTSEFLDSYMGEHDSFISYLQQYVEDTGLLTAAPDLTQRYFDWASFARDEEHNYTVCETPGSVFVFLS